MQQQVGERGLLQRRAERLDQVVRQVPHEADGVCEGVDARVARLGAPCRRVERRKEGVLDEHARAGQPVQQRRLARVGVADDGNRRHLVAATLGPLALAGGVHLSEPAPQLRDPGVDAAAVGLDLRLARAASADARAARGATASLARQVAAPAAEPLLEVLQLGQLDLGLALCALGVLREDVEDQGGAVDDLDLDPVLQVAQLRRFEFAVADDGVRPGHLDDLCDLLDLAAADVGGGVGMRAALHEGLEHLGACRLGEQFELGHRVVDVLLGSARPDADEHDAFESELAVLDLRDVLEFGAHAGDAPQRMARGEVDLVAVVVLLGVVVVEGVVKFSHVGVHSPRQHRPDQAPALSLWKNAGQIQNSPRPTITAGPVSLAWSPSKVTESSPPGTATSMGPSKPLRRR